MTTTTGFWAIAAETPDRMAIADPAYREAIEASRSAPQQARADAIGAAVRTVASLLPVAATIAYTSSGYSALRLARERPQAPVLGMTPRVETARRLALAWGVHAVTINEVTTVAEMSELACNTARFEGFGRAGDSIVIAAGMPFGASGTTNLLRIAQID